MYIAKNNLLLDADLILSKAGLEENMKVADLGCGNMGYFAFQSAKIVGDNGKVFAVDIMRTVLEIIDRKIKTDNLKNIKTVWSDIEKFKATKIENNSLDIVLLINTLYQSQKRVEILRESIRMLKKGGKIVVIEWKNVKIPFGPPVSDRVKIEILKINASKLGLKLEKEFFAGSYHYGLIFIKI